MIEELERLHALLEAATTAAVFPSPIACHALEDQFHSRYRNDGDGRALFLAEAAGLLGALEGTSRPGRKVLLDHVGALIRAASGK